MSDLTRRDVAHLKAGMQAELEFTSAGHTWTVKGRLYDLSGSLMIGGGDFVKREDGAPTKKLSEVISPKPPKDGFWYLVRVDFGVWTPKLWFSGHYGGELGWWHDEITPFKEGEVVTEVGSILLDERTWKLISEEVK